jgi:hypothetical protein
LDDSDKLRANAALVVEQLGPLSDVSPFGYGRDSLAWVESYIERMRTAEGVAPENLDGAVMTLGAYLGECVIRAHGGSWRNQDGMWGVFIDDRNAAFPFSKVAKQFENGVEGGDSILGFFDSIGILWKMKATGTLQSLAMKPEPVERRAMLRAGVPSLAIGGLLVASAIGSLLWSGGAAYALRLLIPGGAALGYGAWHVLRAWRPEPEPVLERSECWECSERIRSAAEGAFCDLCSHPVHTRCKRKHDRVLHPT